METKQSHISSIRKLYSNNAIKIKGIGLSEFAYKELIFDAGINFLELLYPADGEHEKYFKIIAYNKTFWNWWYSEFKEWESDLVVVMQDNNMSKKDCIDEIQMIAHDAEVERSFINNFLKNLSVKI